MITREIARRSDVFYEKSSLGFGYCNCLITPSSGHGIDVIVNRFPRSFVGECMGRVTENVAGIIRFLKRRYFFNAIFETYNKHRILYIYMVAYL